MVGLWPFILTSLAVPCALLRVALGKKGRRITNEKVIAPAARGFVRGLGVELISRVRPRPAGEQVIYTINHSSSLDLAVMGLALPATRGFMKRAMWAMPPLGLLAWAGGCVFTVPQKFPALRRRV
jgi:1-acyl-sn-glycerol-3-phosphate acyltransferase